MIHHNLPGFLDSVPHSKEYWKNKDRRPKNHIEATNNG